MSEMKSKEINIVTQTGKTWCKFKNTLHYSLCILALLSVFGLIHNIIYHEKEINSLNYMISYRRNILDSLYLTIKGNAEISTLCPEKPPNLSRVSEDTTVNGFGRKLLQLCKSTGLRNCNGRTPGDKNVGPITVNTSSPTYEEIEKRYPWVEAGGRYKPSKCLARQTVAIIIPYRNRDSHLRTLLNNLHPFLRKQQVHYGIYVINQEEGSKFNRAMLMNIGFVEALKLYNYSCFIFHDVDLLPEDDRNIYGCFGNPRHLAAAIDKFKHGMPYASYFGGVTALSRSEYEKMNGCSNLFFGWGGEDDDMYNRVLRTKQKVVRYSMKIAKYKMIKHNRDKGNEENDKRMRLIKKGQALSAVDGLNSLVYKRNNTVMRKLYTWISVQINESEVMQTGRNQTT